MTPSVYRLKKTFQQTFIHLDSLSNGNGFLLMKNSGMMDNIHQLIGYASFGTSITRNGYNG